MQSCSVWQVDRDHPKRMNEISKRRLSPSEKTITSYGTAKEFQLQFGWVMSNVTVVELHVIGLLG